MLPTHQQIEPFASWREETSSTDDDGDSKLRKGRFNRTANCSLILQNGGCSLTFIALLDDASTKTYVIADVATELGLQGKTEKNDCQCAKSSS